MNLFRYSVLGVLMASFVGILQVDNFSKIVAVVIGVLGWAVTRWLTPSVKQLMVKKGINGLDINKKGSEAGEKHIPECLGFAAAIAFCMVGLMLTPVLKVYRTTEELNRHMAVLVTILGTILLGFADDILDLKWRYKLLFPFFIIIPLVSVYDGITHL